MCMRVKQRARVSHGHGVECSKGVESGVEEKGSIVAKTNTK